MDISDLVGIDAKKSRVLVTCVAEDGHVFVITLDEASPAYGAALRQAMTQMNNLAGVRQ